MSLAGPAPAGAWRRRVLIGTVVVAIIAAIVVAWISRDGVGDRARVAAPQSRPTLPAVCAPPVDQGVTTEPWSGRATKKASEISFMQGLSGENPGYVTGRDGWLFFNDSQVNDLSQAVGRDRLTRTPIERWNAYFSQMRREAEARGGHFYILIAPAKWDVYPDLLPTWAQKLRGTNSLDRLMAAHPELPFIDVRQPLREAGQDQPTYSRLNSHWTDYGGWVAWKAATACLRAVGDVDAAVDAPAIDGVYVVGDQNEFADDGVEQPADPQRTIPDFVAPHPATTITDIKTGADVQIGVDDILDTPMLPAITSTPQAQSSKTMLVLRDSTGRALSPLWSTSFARTVQYQHPIGAMGAPVDMKRLVDRFRPDITFFTMTERYLSFDPPASSPAP